MSLSARNWLDKIQALSGSKHIKIMNVCGGHERTISISGLRKVLPENIELIPGPGCPVCICPEEDIFEAIQLALNENITLLAFGDMLRVPVNVSKTRARTLEQARSNGADIRPIASPVEAVAMAKACPDKKLVFFAAGFETTMAPVASMLVEGIPDNLSVLLSGRLTWPAVSMLLQSDTPGFDALIAPGHVSTVMGSREWQFVVHDHHLPTAIAGFTPDSLLAAVYSCMRQRETEHLFLDNCYPEVVSTEGNVTAKTHLHQTMDIYNASWRGIGYIPSSGLSLNASYAQHDARKIFPSYANTRKRIGEMPPGCDCAKVVLGQRYPHECRLYGKACTPASPVGPCMVSDEGACRIWLANGMRDLSQATG